MPTKYPFYYYLMLFTALLLSVLFWIFILTNTPISSSQIPRVLPKQQPVIEDTGIESSNSKNNNQAI